MCMIKNSQRMLFLKFYIMLYEAQFYQQLAFVNSNYEYICIIFILLSQTKTCLLRGYSQNNYKEGSGSATIK